MAEYKTCPKCGGIAEYNAYYGRTTCTRCAWESEKQPATGKYIEYIDKDLLYRAIYGGGCNLDLVDTLEIIENFPAADVAPVVRCKDCKHMSPMSNCIRYCEAWGGVNGMGDDGFCNYGERRNT